MKTGAENLHLSASKSFLFSALTANLSDKREQRKIAHCGAGAGKAKEQWSLR